MVDESENLNGDYKLDRHELNQTIDDLNHGVELYQRQRYNKSKLKPRLYAQSGGAALDSEFTQVLQEDLENPDEELDEWSHIFWKEGIYPEVDNDNYFDYGPLPTGQYQMRLNTDSQALVREGLQSYDAELNRYAPRDGNKRQPMTASRDISQDRYYSIPEGDEGENAYNRMDGKYHRKKRRMR